MKTPFYIMTVDGSPHLHFPTTEDEAFTRFWNEGERSPSADLIVYRVDSIEQIHERIVSPEDKREYQEYERLKQKYDKRYK